MPVRIALVLSAALVAVLLAVRLGDERACAGAHRDAAAVPPGAAAGAPADVARRASERCGDVERLALTGLILATSGHGGDGERLLREAVRRSPRSFAAWSSLARVQLAAGTVPEEAMRRALALNPRWKGPAPLAEPAG